MRAVVLLQGSSPEIQIGHHRAYQSLCQAGLLSTYLPIPYIRASDDPTPLDQHWSSIFRRVLDHARNHGIDLLVLQWYHGDHPDPRPMFADLRRICQDVVIVVTCGDPFGRWWQRPSLCLQQASAGADMTLMTSMGYMADFMAAAGARNVLLMANGACQIRHCQPVEDLARPDFDVIFIGSNNGGRNPFTPLSQAGRARRKMVAALNQRFGQRFGLFGRNWKGYACWQGPIPYDQQVATIRRSRVQVGGFPGSYATYYTSDRFYIALAAGIPLLDYAVDRVGSLIAPQSQWIDYDSLPTLLRKVDEQLNRPESDLQRMGEAARTEVLSRHTQAHRVEELVELAREMRHHRTQGSIMPVPRLRSFRSDLNPADEQPWAVRNWRG